jgi:hypothetical protein
VDWEGVACVIVMMTGVFWEYIRKERPGIFD